MTEGVVRTQGSELFTVDRLSDVVAAVLKFECPTGITGLGGARDQIESSCLDTTGDKEYIAGLGNAGQVSVPFNFIPRSVGHQILFDLKESGDVLPWLIGMSDGTAQPALTADVLTPSASPTRSWFGFNAYVADVNIDIATNEIVRGTLTLQRSGAVVPYFNGPYSA